jgi:hypothetical protein
VPRPIAPLTYIRLVGERSPLFAELYTDSTPTTITDLVKVMDRSM